MIIPSNYAESTEWVDLITSDDQTIVWSGTVDGANTWLASEPGIQYLRGLKGFNAHLNVSDPYPAPPANAAVASAEGGEDE